MTKAFIKFPGRAARYSSRRFPQHAFANVAYKEDGDDVQRADLLEKIKSAVSNELATRATKEEVTKLTDQFKDIPLDGLRSFFDKENGVMAILKKQGETITALEESGANQPKDLSIRGQIAGWVENNKQILEDIKNGTQRDMPAMELRVASPMTPANTYNGSAYLPKIEYVPGINEIVRVQPTFWDYIRKGRTGSAALVWVNKVNPLGAAAFIGPGVAKPGISFEIETQISNAKKIAASEKMATELLQDIDGFATWVEQELAYQVKQKASLTLMTGTSSSTVPAGIQTVSVTYTATGVETTNPNNYDALIAAVAQLRSGNLMGPVTAFLNPIDMANMKLTKAISQGQPFIAPETGVTMVEDNNIPVGYVQVALLDYWKVLIYKDFTITYGWENDDFTKNLVTVIGEMRIHQYFSSNFAGAFIYDSLANIKTAITAV